MDFETAPEIQDAIQKRAGHGAFGYTLIPDEWYESIQNWWETRPSVPDRKRLADFLYRRGAGHFQCGSETYDSGGESRASDTGLQHFFQFGCK